MRRLLHLSDIHFRPSTSDALLDVDQAVRADLLRDLKEVAVGERCDAIVVVGDVAATGDPAEYAEARSFLDEVSSIVGCEPSAVLCVPGNHDVARGRQGPTHDGLRHLLRTVPPSSVSRRLRGIFRDGESSEILHRPFAHYNAFAEALGCAVTGSDPSWQPKDLTLSGGKVLRIRGVNSAIACDGTEGPANADDGLVLGECQLVGMAREEDDVVNVLLCHHPLSWLRDADEVRPWFGRAHVVFTGHVHEFGIDRAADGRSVTIAAGAVNPEREGAPWRPAYNVVSLDVVDDRLIVEVRVRRYGSDRAGFEAHPDFSDPEHIEVALQARVVKSNAGSGDDGDRETPEDLQSDERRMRYLILTAPPDRRERAARRTDLLDAGESLPLGAERDLIERAVAAGQLKELVEALEW